jgi:hypothetical protein
MPFVQMIHNMYLDKNIVQVTSVYYSKFVFGQFIVMK